MREPLFLKPVFQERIWGGTQLQDVFHYDIPNEKTGECWAISAHPNGCNIIQNGEFAGLSLDALWKNKRELFGNLKDEKFPILTKILDANDDLSIQVHPDDQYAAENEADGMGKTECWYIIDCKEGAELVFGHSAQTHSELQNMLNNEEWENLFTRVAVHPGDFFYVPSGTVHALCEGTLVLETQQNSDVTYRIYDYDRVDDAGNLRELHVNKSLDVISVPHVQEKVTPHHVEVADAVCTKYVDNDFFAVEKWTLDGLLQTNTTDTFRAVSIIHGKGTMRTENKRYTLEAGEHFILPAHCDFLEFEGELEAIVSYV
ncbi:MAG: mannose-6-phosphate isomerase, class I [Bacilli bacterium]